ncbi:uncharacterized protein LOC121735405 [Aricia agestis]|uniref:uncharacterized protein LOC121735405 n=1 Tax=Aricia agestis TaxID=91739 RepID=UPI001C209E48|nr:uncharacterized protein LOC121735405 [Aricia agestis]
MQYILVMISLCKVIYTRDEEKIAKACYWAHEVYESCFAGCAEASCDNPRARLRPCYPYCEPGCVCDPPYVRDDRTHRCVLPHDCSPTQLGIPIPTSSHTRSHQGIDTVDYDAPINYEDKKPADLSRMGNYFNIVIAPPPAKSVLPREATDVVLPQKQLMKNNK